ncbi:hypothetical protein PHYSODRAFT_341519 [Phytophthora sojae]|uniref:Uncharacterized protein n=1 Tax=Phytophthora sojae (strain P6497) TaxID=1094619 RepID=G5ADI0_PHYSP|nr:hypothetical protein PHYSODRAFT_341519 [Phytophthora sojae]EGZ06233.1 hypothetical protein PHYSODRAFT_341519 [Phytophthora sojae]|eukprot:XP_009538130.1 hypothetical protein PHYSODRAFT_341519 [Phytophthora sojae]
MTCEHAIRGNEGTIPVPAEEVAAIATTLHQLTTVVASLHVQVAKNTRSRGQARAEMAQRGEYEWQSEARGSRFNGGEPYSGRSSDDGGAADYFTNNDNDGDSDSDYSTGDGSHDGSHAAAHTMITRLQPPTPSNEAHGQRSAPRERRKRDERVSVTPGAPDDGGSSSESSNSSSESSSGDDSDGDGQGDESDGGSDEGGDGGGSGGGSNVDANGRHRRNGRRTQRAREPRRKRVKDLELPTYTPSPKVSVLT